MAPCMSMASLMYLNLTYSIGAHGEQLLRDAVADRPGFGLYV